MTEEKPTGADALIPYINNYRNFLSPKEFETFLNECIIIKPEDLAEIRNRLNMPDKPTGAGALDENKFRYAVARELSRCAESTESHDWNNQLHRAYMVNAVVLALRSTQPTAPQVHPAVLEDIIRGALEGQSVDDCGNPILCAKAIMKVLPAAYTLKGESNE